MLATVVSNCPELVKIGNYAFASDAQFDGVDLNGSTKIKEIGESACEHTKSTTVNLSNSTVEKINNRAWNNSGIQTLNLNNCTALELIGGQAFNTCVDLATVTANNVPNLKKIGVSAFCTDYNIKNIDLSSANLQLVEEHAFDYCNSLEEFKIKCNDNCVFEAKCFAGFRQTDSPYPPYTHAPSQQPLNVYIYANVPAARPFDTAVMNAVNNENTPGLVTIHLSSAAESLYKAAATSAKAASPGMDGSWHMVYY